MPVAFTITPKSALFDQPVTIEATGLQPGQAVRLESMVEFPWTPGIPWKASADFLANAAGEIHLAHETDRADPERDPMRLFWSLRPGPGQSPARAGTQEPDTRQPLRMAFSLSGGGQVLASEIIERCFQSPEIQSSPYSAEGVRGRFFFNPAHQPSPAIVFFSGSGSLAPILPISALLASYGVAVLALGYSGAEGLPTRPIEIPVERFEEAITWMSGHPAVIRERIGAMGGSLGGELALLVGSRDARIQAVAAIAASPIIFSELNAGLSSQNAGSPWSSQGQALPFVTPSLKTLAWEVLSQSIRGRAFQYSPAYREVLKNPKAFQQAMIPVEAIRGPILLVSGSNDGYWPASDLGEIALRRLEEHAFAYPVSHLRYAGAGHSFYAPYLLPTSSIETPLMRGVRFSAGGSPAVNSQAQADSWVKILRFLQEHL